jgi:hypothetical protein
MTEHHATDRSTFLRGAAALCLAAPAGSLLGRTPALAAGDPGGLTWRGVTYDTGTGSDPADRTRQRFDQALARGELQTIAGTLHCSSVAVFGSDPRRLLDTARTASELGLHVVVQPRLYDVPQDQALPELGRIAAQAEELRARYAEVAFNVGVESPLFVPGIVPGKTVQDRIARITTGPLDWDAVMRRLNEYLGGAAAAARAAFGGELTYSAATWEQVDWTPFDLVGLDYYEYHQRRSQHVRALEAHRRFGKPIVITEFGTNPFVGAPKLEGDGWTVVDYSTFPPEITGHRVRSERVQAEYLDDMLDVFESMGLRGAYVYTYVEPDLPHSKDPLHDLDLGSFSVATTIRRRFLDWNAPYHTRPKRAFRLLARRYGAARKR